MENEKFDTVKFISELVKFKSVSALAENAIDVSKCAEFLNSTMLKLGFDSELISTDLHPIVYAKRKSRGGEPKVRILCYGHYDVQPVDPIDKWIIPPFEPTVKDGRLWGRGTADNKGPFSCVLAGLMNFLSKNPLAPIDVGIIFEGEEEIGSPSMLKFVGERAEELSAYNCLVFSDTSSASVDDPVITIGLRGNVTFDVRFKGPKADLHSGLFGGAIYNPLQAMAEVCASLHGADGRVNVPHFYDGVLPLEDWEKAQIAANPFGPEDIKKAAGVHELYKQEGMTSSEACRVMPTLEFTGIGGGWQGTDAKSIVPSECFVKISCRLVPNQDAIAVANAVKQAIKERTPKAVEVSFEDHMGASNAYAVFPPHLRGNCNGEKAADSLGKIFAAMDKSVEGAFGRKPIYLREGGSIPLMRLLKDKTGLDCVMLGLFTPQDNLHSPNESMSLKMISRAEECYENFFKAVSEG